MTNVTVWRTRLAHALPFYYGWVIAGNGVALSLSARTVMAVATLSVFVVPMTQSMGWSVGMFSGAVSLGGLAAVFVSPIVGRWLDKYGAGVILGTGSFATGALAIGLAFVTHPLAFYFLCVPGRMIFSGPLEMALPTAVSNWFIRRRPVGLAVDHIGKGVGLVIVPWAMTLIITGFDWRTAWMTLGILAFALGVVPSLFLVARRPEDMGLEPDPVVVREDSANQDAEAPRGPGNSGSFAEIDFTVGQALRTRAFWILAIFSGASMMVQAGLSLHQVSHYINQGIDPRFAALSASTFALAQMPASICWAALARRIPIRFLMTFSSFVVALAAAGTVMSDWLLPEIISAAGVGFGVGGLHLLLRLVWADYYGRQNLGTIRGLTMSAQLGGQALGPVIAGFMFDYFDSYQIPFTFFAVAVFVAGIVALAAKPPQAPTPAPSREPAGVSGLSDRQTPIPGG